MVSPEIMSFGYNSLTNRFVIFTTVEILGREFSIGHANPPLLDITSVNAMLPFISCWTIKHKEGETRHWDSDDRVDILSWSWDRNSNRRLVIWVQMIVKVVLFPGSRKFRHCEHRVGNEIDGNDTFAPYPTVINVGINGGSRIHPVLNCTLLDSLEVWKQLFP